VPPCVAPIYCNFLSISYEIFADHFSGKLFIFNGLNKSRNAAKLFRRIPLILTILAASGTVTYVMGFRSLATALTPDEGRN
jgi:hypothetical protein